MRFERLCILQQVVRVILAEIGGKPEILTEIDVMYKK